MTIPSSHQSATPKPMSPQHLSFFAQPCLALLGRENSWPGQHAQLVPWKIDHFYLLGVGEATVASSGDHIWSYTDAPWNTMTLAYLNILKLQRKKEGLGISGMSWIIVFGFVVVKDFPVNRQIFRMILTLPSGNAKLPPQASPAHSGTCQHGLRCHTQVVHQFGCACMEAPKKQNHLANVLSLSLFLLTSFPSYQCLFGVFHQLGQHLSRPASSVFLFRCVDPNCCTMKMKPGETCFKVLKRRTYTAYTLDKRRTLVWFFTASAAALIFSSNSHGNILGTQPLWHLKARVRIAVPSCFTMLRFLLIP